MLEFYDYALHHGHPNFGDDLNPWLLKRLLPASLLRSSEVAVIGIGTILNLETAHRIRHVPRKIVFSAGAGYGQGPFWPDASWSFSAVRGHLTRQALKLDEDTPVGDGAILITDYLDDLALNNRAVDEVVFMPHVTIAHASYEGWKVACERAGVRFVSPVEPRDEIVSALLNARLVITSAMHGAIVADTLGTPWVAVKSSNILVEKWMDWASAYDMRISWAEMPELPAVSEYNMFQRLDRWLARRNIVRLLKDLKRHPGQRSPRTALVAAQAGLRTAAARLHDQFTA